MIQPCIKWSGSKRSQAFHLAEFVPESYNTYYEPFLGGGTVLYAVNPSKAVCADKCEPLIELWKRIQENPKKTADEYRTRWGMLQEEGQDVYYRIRQRFNREHNPYDLLFLTRTCVNGLIRFNQDGDFNASFHINRKGINPDTLESILYDWQSHIWKVNFISGDYHKTTAAAEHGDLIYLDPPYSFTEGQYYGAVEYLELLEYLNDLNRRKVKYILSYNGVQGSHSNIMNIPKKLYKRHELVYSGGSSFKRIFSGEKIDVYDSVYMNW